MDVDKKMGVNGIHGIGIGEADIIEGDVTLGNQQGSLAVIFLNMPLHMQNI